MRKPAARPYVVREDGNVDTGGRKILYAGTSKEDFGGWWKTLPYKEQIKSVGVERTKLLNAGKISWDDLIDKSPGRIFTLHELGFTQGGKALAVAAGGAGAVAATIASVANLQELAVQLKQELSKYTTNGPITDVIYDHENYMMATLDGKLYISDKAVTTDDLLNPSAQIVLNAQKDLLSAWNKIAKGQPLDQNEELSIEFLWHEVIHNRQVKGKKLGKKSEEIMETFNEWIARRTYSDFLASLGGKARYSKEIIQNGPGYWNRVKNFDALLDAFGVPDDADTLAYFKKIHETVDRGSYKKELADFLSKAGRGKVKRKDINTLLSEVAKDTKQFNIILNSIFKKP